MSKELDHLPKLQRHQAQHWIHFREKTTTTNAAHNKGEKNEPRLKASPDGRGRGIRATCCCIYLFFFSPSVYSVRVDPVDAAIFSLRVTPFFVLNFKSNSERKYLNVHLEPGPFVWLVLYTRLKFLTANLWRYDFHRAGSKKKKYL